MKVKSGLALRKLQLHRLNFDILEPIKIIKHSAAIKQIHRAGKVITSPWRIIDNGYISVEDGIIVDVSSGKNSNIPSYDVEVIDHGPGIIIPALVNGHTHFELSALKGKVPFDRGFNNWVRELLNQRELCGIDLIQQSAQKAMDEAAATGTLLVCEISTLGITEESFLNSELWGIWFQEYLGAISPFNRTLSISSAFSRAALCKEISMAGHAPHTTSPEFLRELKLKTKKADLPFSIHVAESFDETQFICSGKGSWADFLTERGIDYSAWPITSRSPVQYLKDMDLLDPQTIAVHLLNVDIEDIKIISQTGAKPVLCPRSNFNLHRTLPDIPLFLRSALKPALGSDSLASTESLSMFDEMAFVAAHFPQINPSDIFAMATINGADALGYGKIAGTLEKGKQADFIYVPLEVSGNDIADTVMNIITTNSTH